MTLRDGCKNAILDAEQIIEDAGREIDDHVSSHDDLEWFREQFDAIREKLLEARDALDGGGCEMTDEEIELSALLAEKRDSLGGQCPAGGIIDLSRPETWGLLLDILGDSFISLDRTHEPNSWSVTYHEEGYGKPISTEWRGSAGAALAEAILDLVKDSKVSLGEGR